MMFACVTLNVQQGKPCIKQNGCNESCVHKKYKLCSQHLYLTCFLGKRKYAKSDSKTKSTFQEVVETCSHCDTDESWQVIPGKDMEIWIAKAQQVEWLSFNWKIAKSILFPHFYILMYPWARY